MKKILFLAAAFVLTLASCGNKQQPASEDQDSVKAFEQSQIEASIKVQLDSLASEAKNLKGIPGIQNMKDGIQLTEEEKMVKPTYLMDPAEVSDLQTLSEKYRALAMLFVDKKVAEAYDMDLTAYDEAISKLLAEVNDPALGALNSNTTYEENISILYDAENAAGRINLFWEMTTASTVEQVYVLCQNIDKYITAIDDEAAENMTFRMILLTDAMDRLANYDSNVAELNDAIQPLKILDALTTDQLKSQLEELKSDIEVVRTSLLK